ncbi:MAG: protein disulfide oxidoreductase [Shewanella sp.]|nr:protein disulfide oxidoreductase [Shewanella sp.]MCF1431758.1 protein disulfide oxidoreductase [Shewanella sp.]MCF1438754.1 protein disulfide oxidoreductase [Shewanella sp.]MCF1456255.1 protein disulfide oxidoreductase [Shewanella sp.]
MRRSFLSRFHQKSFWLKLLRDLALMGAVIYGISLFLQRDMASGQAPALAGEAIHGTPIKLRPHETTLVYFWGTWCPACKVTSPAVNALSKDYKVISVAVASGTRDEISDYMQKHNYRFPVMEGTQAMSDAWGASALPAIYIVRDGEIQFVTRGVTSEWGLALRLWLSNWLA